MKCTAGIKDTTRLEVKIFMNGPITLINKTPLIKRKHKVEDKNPRISASTISPIYIGSTVYMAPSVTPIISLRTVRCQMLSTTAIPTNPRKVAGARSNMDLFLPILSAIFAASTAPIKQPINAEVAHQLASNVVVGMVVEFDKRYGRYGEHQPAFTPNAIVDKVAERWIHLLLHFIFYVIFMINRYLNYERKL